MSIATDLAGRVIWYYDAYPNQFEFAMRHLPGGTMLFLGSPGSVHPYGVFEIDLAGNTIRETNIERVNEQLAFLGQDRIVEFHHEAIRLPSNHTLVLGYVERMFSNVQGSNGPVNVIGIMIIDLDENWQVSWTWNAFDHLDINRAAILNEKCSIYIPSCPDLKLSTVSNDWLHANSIDYSYDGNLIVSLRNQDWVIKIDYRNGSGTGAVLWRLGKDGDFTLLGGADDPYPWFSHQHDARYAGQSQVTLFDNGNTRCQQMATRCFSRGQAWSIDEVRRVARLDVNANLGGYSGAWGSAERLLNGNYHFTAGKLLPGPYSRSIEVRADGEQTYVLEVPVGIYRSYRVRSLYEP
jgi:hypothetical protein